MKTSHWKIGSFFLVILTFVLGCSQTQPLETPDTGATGNESGTIHHDSDSLSGAAAERAIPKSPEELVAQLKRSIIQEDREGLRSLFYRLEVLEAVGQNRKNKPDAAEDAFGDHRKYVMTQIEIRKLDQPLPDRILRRKVNGKDMTMTPNPTHSIRIKYLRPMEQKTGSRISGYQAGEMDGVWYISILQPNDER